MNSSIVSVLQPDEPIDRGKEVRSTHIYRKIVASMEVDVETDGESRTELDSHANMPVVGREALVVEQSGKMVEVSPFTPDYKPIKVEVVNVPRYTVRMQLEKIMPLSLRDMISVSHYSCMGYFPILLQGNQMSNQLWMHMSH